MQLVNTAATVVSSDGALGKYSRGRRPLLFSTELVRSTKDGIGKPHELRAQIRELAERLDEEEDEEKKQRLVGRLDEKPGEIERSVAVYGMITPRSDGRKVLLARKLEAPRPNGQKWDIHVLEPEDGELGYRLDDHGRPVARAAPPPWARGRLRLTSRRPSSDGRPMSSGIRRASVSTLRGLALALAACAVGLAAPLAAAAEGDPRYLSEPEQQAWAERLAEAEGEIGAAQARVERLEAAYAEAQHSGHPRGEARAELERELARARQDLEKARAALPRLVEEARRAGVYPEVLRPYKDW